MRGEKLDVRRDVGEVRGEKRDVRCERVRSEFSDIKGKTFEESAKGIKAKLIDIII